MNIINREIYTDRIMPFVGKGIIKVLTGQRRVGKSYILLQLIKEINESDSNANIVFVNLEFEEFRQIKNDSDLFAYLQDKFILQKTNYLFIDEIQEITGFEHVLRSLHAKNTCDIIITGSNAKMLSSELSTNLAGRYIEFHIQSLSYAEFLVFHKLDNNHQSLMLYLTYGGLPYLSNFPLKDEFVFEYLRNVYFTIILRDVVQRENIRNVDFLETLLHYTADNVGSLFSANNISKYLKSQRTDISTPQVISYLRYLSNAYIINKVVRMDVNGLKKFEIGEKYYFEDIGLRNCQVGFSLQRDIHKLIENAVFLHLKNMQYDVFVGKKDAKEIDFVGIKQGRKLYIQAAYLLSDEITQKREFGNLLSIQDNYPKYVVSLDDFYRESEYEGIKHLNLREFLLNTNL
ncbi:MAG: ATP-binding protein [Paludibacter sp.]|nr:ATP-binding protein [Paludibacter sp.]